MGTLLMAVFANYPFALAPGMGLNAYFAYTVVLGMGYTWQVALTAVFVEGIIFIILSLTSVREAIFNAIPRNLKAAVSVGIGLFIGLQNANIVVGGSTLLELYSLDGYNAANGVEGTFNDVGITVILAVAGILITWVLGIGCQLAGLYVPNPEAGSYGLLPDFSRIFSLNFLVVIFAFLFVDMFDTIGTLIGVSSKAGMLDEEGRLPRIKGALLAGAGDRGILHADKCGQH